MPEESTTPDPVELSRAAFEAGSYDGGRPSRSGHAARASFARDGAARPSTPCQPWAWSTILIGFPELRFPG